MRADEGDAFFSSGRGNMSSRRSKRRNEAVTRPVATSVAPVPDASGIAGSQGTAVAAGRGIAATELPRWYWASSACVTAVLGAWLFGPTIVRLVGVWNNEPDYSHGFLVPPIAAVLLWLRRESFLQKYTRIGR